MQRQEKAIQGEPNVPLLDKLTKIKQTNGGFADGLAQYLRTSHTPSLVVSVLGYLHLVPFTFKLGLDSLELKYIHP
jgi:hypothetical protein